MAGESEKELENPADTIQHLRGIAERHLRQIDEEKEQDERDDLRRLEELQHYAKPRRRNKTADVPSSTSTTGPKMRSAQGRSID